MRAALRLGETADELEQLLPADVRASARELPSILGLGAWDTFLTFAPNQDLPGLVAADLGIPPSTTRPFQLAHHALARAGLIADRLEDRQVSSSKMLIRLRNEHVLTAKRLLGERCPRRLVRRELASITCAWRRASTREERWLEEGKRVSQAEYAETVREKLLWATAATTLLLNRAKPDASSTVVDTFLRFLIGLQVRDDALDTDDDRRRHGHSWPDVLCLPAEALRIAAPPIVQSAASRATALGFARLAHSMKEVCICIQDAPGGTRPNGTRSASLASLTLGAAAIEATGGW